MAREVWVVERYQSTGELVAIIAKLEDVDANVLARRWNKLDPDRYRVVRYVPEDEK